MLSEPFAAALKSDRESFNARFAERRLAGSQIDGGAFLDHLQTVVDPIVQAVAARFPERTRAAVGQLYDLSLDLFTAALLGPRTRSPHVDAVWRRLLPALGVFLARDPARIAGSLSNAAWNLGQQPDVKVEWWIDRMRELSAHCDSLEGLLECGKVLAWQAGMAQYRTAALETAGNLAPVLAARALQLPAGADAAHVHGALDRLKLDPWLTAEKAQEPAPPPQTISCVRTLGAFRGFGGTFLRPPSVSSAEGSLWVGDGESFWRMQADAYGWHLQRSGSGPVPANQGRRIISMDRQGTVQWDDVTARFPELSGAVTAAFDGTTLAVTIPTSHHVFLLARR